MTTALTAVVVIACAASCTDDDARARLDKVEERMARMEKTLERIDSLATKLDGIDRRLDRTRDLEDRLDRLERTTQRAPRMAAARPTRPDSTAVYAVPIDGSPSLGPRDAKVTLVQAFEFACPFCRRVMPTIEQLRRDYGRDLRVVYKHLVVHPTAATTPALAACAAHRQGRFSRMYELIWRKGFDAGRNLGRDNMERLAREAGLSMRKFRRDLNGVCADVVRTDQQQLARVGARGTPSFFINGRFLSGARPIDQFKAVIDEELSKANKRIRAGTRQRDYYKDWVLDKGRQTL